jgi:hypothetical protein
MRSGFATLALFLLLPGCVVLVPDDPPEARADREHLIENLRIDGLETTVETVDSSVVTDTTALASGYSENMLGLYSVGGGIEHETSTTEFRSPKVSDALRRLAVVHAENQRFARLVNKGGAPELWLQGRVDGRENVGTLWTVPVNTVLFCGLVLPFTWGERFSVTLRAYAPDGEYLRSYTATADVRSWHHWKASVREEADLERFTAGTTIATMRALDQVFDDLASGRLSIPPQRFD